MIGDAEGGMNSRGRVVGGVAAAEVQGVTLEVQEVAAVAEQGDVAVAEQEMQRSGDAARR